KKKAHHKKIHEHENHTSHSTRQHPLPLGHAGEQRFHNLPKIRNCARSSRKIWGGATLSLNGFNAAFFFNRSPNSMATFAVGASPCTVNWSLPCSKTVIWMLSDGRLWVI